MLWFLRQSCFVLFPTVSFSLLLRISCRILQHILCFLSNIMRVLRCLSFVRGTQDTWCSLYIYIYMCCPINFCSTSSSQVIHGYCLTLSNISEAGTPWIFIGTFGSSSIDKYVFLSFVNVLTWTFWNTELLGELFIDLYSSKILFLTCCRCYCPFKWRMTLNLRWWIYDKII